LTTLKTLKKHNFITAIISGGIDTFYEEALPLEIKSRFDKVYFNKFEYDNHGLFKKVVSDAYDFSGKAKALEEICKFANCNLEEAVFVGEGTNDCDVGSCGCLSIAYPAQRASKAFREVAKVEVDDDNISAILGEILIPAENYKLKKNRRFFNKRR
jgi:phosphoserine phosphatase